MTDGAVNDDGRRPFRSLVGLVVVVLLVLLAVAGLKSYRDLQAARQRQASLEAKIEETRHRNQDLERRIELLDTDPATLERLAREDLGMVRPGDVVIVLPGDPPAPPTPSAPPPTSPASP